MGVVNRYGVIFAIFALLLLAACTKAPIVTCNKPYIQVGNECCLDDDGNSICDADEGKTPETSGHSTSGCPELDCSLCPATVMEKEVTVTETKYVCEGSGITVVDPADCEGNEQFNAFKDYKLYTGAEKKSVITDFTLRPACRESRHAVELHYEAGSLPSTVVIQVKESPTDTWEDVYTLESPSLDKYLYGVFCHSACSPNAQWFLEPGKVYLLRAQFDYNTLFSEYQYSNEYLVDTRDDGEFMTKLC